MTAFAKVRLKPGAKCFQDRMIYTWPPSQYDDGYKIGIPDDSIFIAEKRRVNGKISWFCKTNGAGIKGNYGNGGIIVYNDEIEMLTPMLGYEPTLDT